MTHALLLRRSSQPARKKQAAAGNAPTSLRIGEPDDAFEREADRIADEIMAGGMLKRHWSISEIGIGAPRKCECGGANTASGECEECEKKKDDRQVLQRRALGGTSEPAVAPSIVHDVLNSPGQPLNKETRAFFEPRFGVDLSDVRLHTDVRARESAKAVQARAYTVGQHIVFSDSFSIASSEGSRLFAHELTHALQQSQDGGIQVGDSNLVSITTGLGSVVARNEEKNQPPPGLRSTGLTQQEAAQLQATRTQEFNVPAGKSTLVGILIDEETGKRYPVRSGEFGGPYGGTQRGNIPRGRGEGFSGGAPTEKNIVTHIEGHAAAIMHEQKIRRATLLSPEPPCRVCSSPTRTPAVSVVLPPESRLTVVYPGGADTFWSSALPPSTPKGGAGSPSGGGQEEEPGTPSAKGTTTTTETSEESGTSGKGAVSEEGEVEGRPARRVGGAGGAAEPGFTRALGFAALNFAAGVGTSLMQSWMHDKILNDIAKLPQPRPDKRGVSEFLGDPATGSAVRLLDLLSKDIKPFTGAFKPQHEKIMIVAQFEMAAIALLPGKTTTDSERRFMRLDALVEEMDTYDEQLSTIESNLDALLSLESNAMKTKAAADDLVAKLPTMFAVQAGASSALGNVPMPDVEEYSKIESNLKFISASIGMVFPDAHAAKKVVDGAVEEVMAFRAALNTIWWNEFGAQFAALQKEKAASRATRQAQPPPPELRSTPSAQPQGPQLLPTPGPPQQEQKFEPFGPGAPPVSPYRDVEAKKKDFAAQALELVEIGNQVLSSSGDNAKAEDFKRREANWRKVVTAWLEYYQKKGPDTGVSAMKELLESDQYGGRLKQIRQTLGG